MSDPHPAREDRMAKRVPHAASGELGIVPLISHLVHELAKPRFVWVVTSVRFDHVRVYTDENRAKAAFFEVVSNIWNDIEPVARIKLDCNCKDCVAFCKAEQQKSFLEYKERGVKDAKREYDDAVHALNMKKTEEGERKVKYCAEHLDYWQTYNEDDLTPRDIYDLWRGLSKDELTRQLLTGESDAWRFFHFYSYKNGGTKDDGEGGLCYHFECDGEVCSKTSMKRAPLE